MKLLRYNRDNFFDTMTDNDGNVLTDPIAYDFKEFIEFMKSKDVKVIRINESDEASPDLLSFREYGTHEYWWVICYLNKILDPMNELEAGMQIAIPFIADIEQFKQSQASVNTRGESVILR